MPVCICWLSTVLAPDPGARRNGAVARRVASSELHDARGQCALTFARTLSMCSLTRDGSLLLFSTFYMRPRPRVLFT